MSKYCPYCNVQLAKIPTRKSKCLHCGKSIYVKPNQSLFPSMLLKEEEAKIVDQLKSAEYIGASEQKFNEVRNELSAKFGMQASLRDTMWSLLNKLALELGRSGATNELSVAYYIMAKHLYDEGKDGIKMIREANRARLASFNGAIGVELQAFQASGCEACVQLNSKVMKLSDALKDVPFPPENCECASSKKGAGYCACSYRAIFEAELAYNPELKKILL